MKQEIKLEIFDKLLYFDSSLFFKKVGEAIDKNKTRETSF